MGVVKVFDDSGKLIREGVMRAEDEKTPGFVVRYELLGIIALMLIQTMGGIWWAATTSTNLTNVRAELSEIKQQFETAAADRYRATDAVRDQVRQDQRIEKLEDRIERIEGNGYATTLK